MLIALSGAAAVSALLAIGADRDGRRHRGFYLLKPLTTVLIAGIAASGAASAYQQWILVALLLSLAGDVCLMFAGPRAFLASLASFLIAHLAFTTAFLQGVGAVPLPGWLAVVPLGAAALLWWVLPRAGRLKLPVLIYAMVIGAMVFAAAAREQALGDTSSTLALAGALLFMLSDACLAVRRFVHPYRHAQAIILSTYWVAIGLIAWSV